MGRFITFPTSVLEQAGICTPKNKLPAYDMQELTQN